MNLVEIYDFNLDELLEQEKKHRDAIQEIEEALVKLKEAMKRIQKEKQELKEDLEDNLRFWEKHER